MKKINKSVAVALCLILFIIGYGTYLNNTDAAYDGDWEHDRAVAKGELVQLSRQWERMDNLQKELEKEKAKVAEEAARLRKDFNLGEK